MQLRLCANTQSVALQATNLGIGMALQAFEVLRLNTVEAVESPEAVSQIHSIFSACQSMFTDVATLHKQDVMTTNLDVFVAPKAVHLGRRIDARRKRGENVTREVLIKDEAQYVPII